MTGSSPDQQPSGASSPSLQELRSNGRPYVEADSDGLIVSINTAFEQTYGWSIDQLQGKTINQILPSSYHMAHQLGFSRYNLTGQSTILAHPLKLKTICSDGREILSEHFIVAEQNGDGWVFGATLTPLDELE